MQAVLKLTALLAGMSCILWPSYSLLWPLYAMMPMG